jgi:hypothetical protein
MSDQDTKTLGRLSDLPGPLAERCGEFSVISIDMASDFTKTLVDAAIKNQIPHSIGVQMIGFALLIHAVAFYMMLQSEVMPEESRVPMERIKDLIAKNIEDIYNSNPVGVDDLPPIGTKLH